MDKRHSSSNNARLKMGGWRRLLLLLRTGAAADGRVAKEILGLSREKKGSSVDDLVAQTGKSLGVPRPAVARSLYGLWTEGKLSLQDPNPPQTAAGYVLSAYALPFWFTIGAILSTVLAASLVPAVTPYVYVRYVLGSIFVLYLSGAAFVELFYPVQEDLRPLERLAFSMALSLTLTTLVGLVLSYTPWGVRLDSIMLSLALLTGLSALGATVRKSRALRAGILSPRTSAAAAAAAADERTDL